MNNGCDLAQPKLNDRSSLWTDAHADLFQELKQIQQETWERLSAFEIHLRSVLPSNVSGDKNRPEDLHESPVEPAKDNCEPFQAKVSSVKIAPHGNDEVSYGKNLSIASVASNSSAFTSDAGQILDDFVAQLLSEYQSGVLISNKEVAPKVSSEYESAASVKGKWSRLPVIKPASRFFQLWMLSSMFFLAYELVIGPYRTMFQDIPTGGPYWVFEEIIITGFFLSDILLTFRIAFYEIGGNGEFRLVVDPARIRARYLRSWFIVDLVASFPYGLLELALASGEDGRSSETAAMRVSRGVRVLRWVRLVRMMRVAKLKTVIQHIESVVESSARAQFVWTLLRILAMMLFTAHFTACLWYTVGKAYEDYYPNQNNDEPSSWTQRFIPDYVDQPGSRYIYALHFSMTTMTTVGYGDIYPTNIAEMILTQILLLVSSIVFAGMLTILNGSVAQLYHAGQAKQKACQELTQYMQWRDLPAPLRMRARAFFSYVWDVDREVAGSEKNILRRLSPSLRAEILHHAYGKVIKSAPFFLWIFGSNDVAWRELAMHCESCFFFDGDVLFVEGQSHRNIYFLVFGYLLAKVEMNSLRQEQGLRSPREQLPVSQDQSEQANRSIPETGPWDPKIRNSIARSGTGDQSPSPHFKQMGRSNKRTPAKTKILFQNQDEIGVRRSSKPMKSKTMELKDNEAAGPVSGKGMFHSAWFEVLAKAAAHCDDSDTNGATITERQIAAPAFIGESCLWHEESEAFRTKYTVMCTGRCECVRLSYEGVVNTANDHPGVKKRFGVFRDAINNRTSASQIPLVDPTSRMEFSKSSSASAASKSPSGGQSNNQWDSDMWSLQNEIGTERGSEEPLSPFDSTDRPSFPSRLASNSSSGGSTPGGSWERPISPEMISSRLASNSSTCGNPSQSK